jgi:hypothetical protein
MVTSIQAAVDAFREINTGVISAIDSCPEDRLRQPSIAEGWPLAVVAHHIAVVNSGFAGMIDRFAAGDTYTPDTSMDTIHEINAQHARDYADVAADEVLKKLGESAAAIETSLGKLTDDQLSQPAGVYGGNPLSVGQVIEYVVLGHTREHADSIRNTLAG